MKKTIFAAIAFACTLTGFNSCFDDKENEYHETTFYPLYERGIECYADQALDTTNYVISTDSWTAEVKGQGGEPAPWMTVSPKEGEVKPGYVLQQRLQINLQKNDTEKTRRAYIAVTAPSGYDGAITMALTQYYWLNIEAPMPVLTPNNAVDGKISFTANLLATDKAAITRFTVYSDATLTSDADWLTVPADEAAPKAGKHSVNLVVTPNESAEARTAHLTLTSAGISNVITYNQAGKK